MPSITVQLARRPAQRLMLYVPRPLPVGRKSTETRVDLDLLKQVCLLINTADYCQTTAVEVCIPRYLGGKYLVVNV